MLCLTTESTTSVSYLDLLLSVGRDGQFHTSIYDKRDDFNFRITNFPFLSSNIPSSPAYGVFISQLIRYARACSSYECFILRARRLSSKLLKQGYLAERLKSSFRKFYGRYGDLIQQYEVSLLRMLIDILVLDQAPWGKGSISVVIQSYRYHTRENLYLSGKKTFEDLTVPHYVKYLNLSFILKKFLLNV